MGRVEIETIFTFYRMCNYKTVGMLNFRSQLVTILLISCSVISFGQTKPKANPDRTQKRLDSLLLISSSKNQLIEKLKAENKHLQAMVDAAKINQHNTTDKASDCSEKLADQASELKKQRLEIDQLNMKIKLLESQLGKTTTKEPVAEVPKAIIHTVKIGNQTWMTSNLNVTTFRNGDPIMEAQTVEEWERCGKKKIPAWCWYDNDPKTDKKSGKLYNWYAVNDPRGLAPEGYHVPNEEDWKTLVNHLGGELEAAPKMRLGKEWGDSATVVHSKTNFAAVPTGWRLTSPDGTSFTSEGADWWCATPLSLKFAWTRYVIFFSKEVKSYCYPKASGLAVRCLKD
jgi:uncharacterized protein (TIGR02145 family)